MARGRARLLSARFAIYYAPPPGSALAATAARWFAGEALPPGMDAARHAEITASPRHYGFHATLKPPFALVDGTSQAELEVALADFARTQPAFDASPMAVRNLGGFLALMLTRRCRAMQALADGCVEVFDRFRKPAEDGELAKRRAAGLSPVQDAMLQRWGYPYVFAEFRFHMTLTCRLDDVERGRVAAALEDLFAESVGAPRRVADVALFSQPRRDAPFAEARRFALTG